MKEENKLKVGIAWIIKCYEQMSRVYSILYWEGPKQNRKTKEQEGPRKVLKKVA
jgi:hypothetical protein